MGKSGSGKTSMRSIIFANYIARDTSRLGFTIEVNHCHAKFLGNLHLNLWDCGGQDNFMYQYLEQQRDHIFCNVEVLIYVFDVKSTEKKKDLNLYRECIEAILQNSPNAKVFCLVHKMDLIEAKERNKVFKNRENELIELSKPKEIKCFKTSIWDETLYRCWSNIVYSLIPNIQIIEEKLDKFTNVCGADEVVLFERATFLVIAHSTSTRKTQNDVHRFEKISNILKQFKLSCARAKGMFDSIQMRNNSFQAFVEKFTEHTYIIVVTSDNTVSKATTLLNIKIAKKHFEKFLSMSEGEKKEENE